MISENLIRNALNKERVYWKKRNGTEYIQGIVRGCKIALDLVDKLPKHKWDPQIGFHERHARMKKENK